MLNPVYHYSKNIAPGLDSKTSEALHDPFVRKLVPKAPWKLLQIIELIKI
jgi:hypothetical protein